METLTVGEAIDYVVEVGGSLQLDGEQVALTLPGNCSTEAEGAILKTLRANRDAVAAMLRDMGSKAPSLEEVKASLPPGVKLVSYRPKQAPFAVRPVSLVTNAGQFYTSYLRDLAVRLAQPKAYCCSPLADILSKLFDAGLELRIDAPVVPNAQGVVITDADIPF